jgi:TonB family protein
MYRFCAGAMVIAVMALLWGSNYPAGAAQPQAATNCLALSGAEPLDDRTLALTLTVKLAGAAQAKARANVRVYTVDSRYTVAVDRTASKLVALPINSDPPDPATRVAQPLVLKLPVSLSKIKGIILEPAPSSAACQRSMLVYVQRRSTDFVRTDIRAIAYAVPPITVPAAEPVALSCPVPFEVAHVISVANVETPPQARGVTGEVQVLLDLAADGTVKDARIKSSPSPLLNAAALDAAKKSTYAPNIVACVPNPQSYIFVVEFQSQ